MGFTVQLDGHGETATARESEEIIRGGDALVYCGQPDGQRQLLRLAQLPDKVDGVAQVCTCPVPTHHMLVVPCQLRLRVCPTF